VCVCVCVCVCVHACASIHVRESECVHVCTYVCILGRVEDCLCFMGPNNDTRVILCISENT